MSNERVAKLPDTKSNADILKKLEGHFHEAVQDQSWKDFLKNAVKVSDYKENSQWTDAEVEELVNVRHQPLYINNQVKVTIDFLNGQFAQLKSKMGARPRNGKADQKSADVVTDLFRYIHQNNNVEFEERDCADDGFTLGRGVLDVQVGFDELFQPEVSIRMEDALAIHPDPHSRHYDWNEDALYVCRSKWVDVDKAVELNPDKETELRGLMGADPARGDLLEKDRIEGSKESRLIDADRNRIRLVEVQYKKFKRQVLWIAEDRTILGEDISDKDARKAGYSKLVSTTHKIFIGVFTEGLLLSHDETEDERFSFVQFLVHRKRSGEPYGPTWPALPLQDSINKRGSKGMHLLNSRGVIFERGAVVDKDALATELAKPDFQVELQEGAMEKKFQFVEHRELAAAHMQFHDSDLANFRRVTGINPDALGEKTEIRSGIGVARKVAQTKVASAGAFDNFRRTRVALWLTVLDRIQHYYTPRKIELVTDSTEAATTIDLNPETLTAIKQAKYDMIISEMPDLVNTEEEQFQVLSTLLPTMAQTSPFWAKMLLKASSLRDKDKFIKELEALSKGPQINPKMTITAQLDNMAPVERAFLYQQMGAENVAEIVMQENRPTTNMVKLQSEQMKLQAAQAKVQAIIQQAELKLRTEQASAELKLEVEEAKAQAETIKAKLEIVKAQLELEKQKLEIEKAELAVEKAEVDVEKTRAQATATAKKAKESK